MRDRIADVRRVLEAARAVALARASIAPAIVESTGLSAAGVELALTKHLELDATDEELRSLVERAGDTPRVTVILSANVFVGALRAIAFARAASAEVVVRPSRRDPAFARALVGRLADPSVRLVDSLDVASVDVGEIHVYGRDDTIAEVREAAKVPVRGHGSGMGVAFVSRDFERAAKAVADDVVVFDQRGCLSPRIVLVDGDANAFAEALHAALEASTVPRGEVPSEERAHADRYIATMTYACRALVGREHAIGVAPPGAPLVLPPPYRHVHVATAADAATLTTPLAKGITAVGTDDRSKIAWAPAWARISALGEMQRPPLDGPVDLR